jgi:hypothetical protein
MKELRIILGLVGALLFALGVFHTVPDVQTLFVFFNSNEASATLMISPLWPVATLGGALLCFLCFFVWKSKV